MILPNQLHLTSLSHCVLEVFEDMPIVVPSSASVLTKSLVELGCLTILSGPMLYVHLIASNYGPFERGYFCDDQSIKHPYTEVFNFLNGIILRSVSLGTNCSNGDLFCCLVLDQHHSHCVSRGSLLDNKTYEE